MQTQTIHLPVAFAPSLKEDGLPVFDVQLSVRKCKDGEVEVVTARVDTGATHSILPTSLLERLGIEPITDVRMVLADGSIVETTMGSACLAVDDADTGEHYSAPCYVIFGSDEGQCTLGVSALDFFYAMVDTVEQKLVRKVLRERFPG